MGVAIAANRRFLERREWLAALGLALALAVPFLDKPIHIDDPVVLRVSENVLRDAADPLAGRMDWFGHQLPVWEVTTNPPLLSYWLAPVVALFGDSEIALHAAMIPFLAAMALGLFRLSDRFTARKWMPTLFVMSSPAFLVSINLMRDVPAVSLLVLGMALFVDGVDREDRRRLLAGSLICGLAGVVKYSAVLGFPLLAWYALAKRPRLSLFSLPTALPLAAWCLLTQLRYGWVHPLYLMSGAHPNRTADPIDQLLAAVAIVGCGLYLGPVLWAACGGRGRLAALGAALAAVAAAWSFRGGFPGGQVVFWTVAGSLVLWICVGEGLAGDSGGAAGDGFFLAVWALAFLTFSVLLTPFQAVRHVLPALPPLTLLAFRFLDRERERTAPPRGRIALPLLLATQASMAFAVNIADAEYAATYRDFASDFSRRHESPARTWFVGHWGWLHYAQKAGFRQLHRDGPRPQSGDYLIWPERVHVGDVWAGSGDLRRNWELVETVDFDGAVPLRTMNFQCAAFYATIRGNLPYCWQTVFLERFRVFRVRGEGG